MTEMKRKQQKIFLIFIFVLFLSSTSLLYTPSKAQADGFFDFFGRLKRFFVGSRPQGVATGRQRGGARRDRCPYVFEPLLAIVPFNQKDELFVEKTVSERPVFWFYVPYLPSDRRKAEFVIIDENEEDVYSVTFPWFFRWFWLR